MFQLENNNGQSALLGLSADASTAPVGINPVCGILKVGSNGSLGNIANILACGFSVLVVGFIIWLTGRRKAAVGAFHVSNTTIQLSTHFYVT